jgi:hypothetical protein
MIGRVLQWLRFPGLLKPFEYRDGETGSVIRLRTSRYYSILTIGDKELYFQRESGKLDGAGAMSDVDQQRLSHLRAAGRRRARQPRALP